MKKQILEILNRNGVHIPTVGEWMEIAKLLYDGKASDFTAEWYSTKTIQLMQRFEELTRGKWEYPMVSNDSKSAVRAAHVIENGKVWQPALLKKEMFEGESAWFEGADEEIIDAYLSETVFEFIYDISNSIDCKVRFNANFVKELLK